MRYPDRFRIEVSMSCEHNPPCVIDHFSAADKAASNGQLAAVLETEPADKVRRRRVRTADEPADAGDWF